MDGKTNTDPWKKLAEIQSRNIASQKAIIKYILKK